MQAKLTVLKLILDELGIPDSIETVDDRKRVQKAIYLTQLTGVHLGYRFGWYKKGPYSPDLTKDYYALADAIQVEGEEFASVKLQPEVRKRLDRVKPLLDVPHGVSLQQEDWLELVSSVHFLRKISKRTQVQSVDVINAEKPQLSEFIPAAERALSAADLLSG